MMKKIVATLFFLSLFLIAVFLIAPSLINWDTHKEKLIAQIQPYVGRKIEVKGKVSFSLLPSPQISLQDVTLANVEGSKADSLMTLQRLEAKIKFEPLLQGKLEVENINLAGPKLNLEVLDDGSVNWTGVLKEQETSIQGDTIRLNKVTLTDGQLRYNSQVTGAEWIVDNLNLDISADTLAGPYRANGKMKYGDNQIAVEINSSKPGTDGAVPLTVTLSPTEGLPKIAFDGAIGTQPELTAAGRLAITEGKMASMLSSPFLKNIPFLNDAATFNAHLEYKGREVTLSDIDAKFGEKGVLSGTLAIGFEKDKKPLVTADLTGSNLKVAAKPGFPVVPGGFDASLKLKGKAITWAWTYMQGVNLSLATDKEEWVIKDARFDMSGKSVVKLAGVVTPAHDIAGFTVMLTTEDFQKFAKAMGMGDSNILKSLGESGVLKKADISTSLDVKKQSLRFFDIDAQLETATKMSGTLDINTRKGDTPDFKANLHFEQGDIGLPFGKAFAPLSSAAMKAKGEIAVTVRNFSRGEMRGQDFNFNATLEGGKMQVVSFLSMTPSFNVRGTVSGFSPLTGMDLRYEFQREKLGMFAGVFGFELPPPLLPGQQGKTTGTVTGDASLFNFTLDGALDNGHVEIQGKGTRGEQAYSWENSVSINRQDNGVWAQLGVPLDRLLENPEQKTYKLAAQVRGTRDAYKISSIRTDGVTSGALARSGGKYEGDIEANKLNFDAWLSNDSKLDDKLALNLAGKQLEWRDNMIDDAKLKLEGTRDSIKATDVTGKLWGGTVKAAVDSTKADKWKGSLKGSLQGAEIGDFLKLMEFDGISAGKGDIDFNLTEDDAKTADDWFAGMEGDIKVKTDRLTVESFSPAKFVALIATLRYAPDDFAEQALKALTSADTSYFNVAGDFRVGNSKITVEKLKMADDDASVNLTGSYMLGPESFDIAADVQMKNSPLTPYFTLTRKGVMGKAPGYTLDLEALANYIGHLVKEPGDVPPPKEPLVKPPVGKPLETPPPMVEKLETPVVIGPAEGEQEIHIPEEGGVDDTAPIETEELVAPPTPSPDQPGPAPAPAPAPNGDIKGILDRLDDGDTSTAPVPEAQPENMLPKQ